MNDLSLTDRVILFSRFLKERGFKIFSSSIVDVLQSLGEIDISSRRDFFYLLRTNLVTNDEEWNLFGALFEDFWKDLTPEEEMQCQTLI